MIVSPFSELSAGRAVQGQRHGIAGVQCGRVKCRPQCRDLENQKANQEPGDGQRVRHYYIYSCIDFDGQF